MNHASNKDRWDCWRTTPLRPPWPGSNVRCGYADRANDDRCAGCYRRTDNPDTTESGQAVTDDAPAPQHQGQDGARSAPPARQERSA